MKHFIYLSIIFLMLTGCHSHKHDHSHSHDIPLMISAYDDKYEVFVEAQPFAKGKQSEVTVFLTHLNNFKPANVSSITLSLIVDNQGIRQTIDNAVSEGVYQFFLTPETVGDAYLLFDIQSDSEISKIQMDGIVVYEDAHTAEHIAEEQAPDFPNAISFNKQQQWKIDFETALPTIELFGQVIKTTGQLESSQIDESIISAKTSGIVAFKRNVLEGQSVQAGQELFVISGSGIAENNINLQFAEAQNRYQKAEADYKRAQELLSDKIVSEKDFLEIKSIYENAKAVYDNLYKNFSANGQRVSSPISGFIRQLYVSNDQYVEAGQALLSVTKNKSLFLKADVQAKYASLLPTIVSANIRTLNSQKTYSLDELNGKVLSYGKSLNEDNYMLPITFQIDNKGDFISGGFVEVYIKMQSNKSTMTLPNTAITEEQGNYFVFVQLTPELFEKREVAIGATDGIRTEIRSGLEKNERIVTRGAISVKLAQSAGALDPHAGHVH